MWKVKPLEWSIDKRFPYEYWTATTEFAEYYVSYQGGRATWGSCFGGNEDRVSEHHAPTIADAMRLANADWLERVQACLEPLAANGQTAS